MGQRGKFQVYYERIKAELEKIKKENNYITLSKAFAHWYLFNFCNVDANDLGESILDGFGDNGIDAIILENDTMKLYQFKFPDKIDNLVKKIDEKTVLKLLNGYKKLNSSRTPQKSNEIFKAYREIVKNQNIFNYEFIFISFSDGLSENAEDAMNTAIQDIKESTGNLIKVDVNEKIKICNKIDRLQKKNVIEINLRYNSLIASYNIEEKVKSWVGFTTAHDILEAVDDSLDIIFDENIRNYEGDNSVNQGIIKTAIDEVESENFYFYHNGIVFICDECKISRGNQIANLMSAAVVNGCQTVVALANARDEQKSLKENVFLPIRIIETKDIELRAKITEYLNSQTKIKDSYFLANNTFIRELQNELMKKGYFLERLANEYSYKKDRLKNKFDYNKDHILRMDKTIQIYAGYYNNEFAAIAKRGKNELFNKEIINEIISGINADKVLIAYNAYEDICKIITLYRKCRRTERNDEFLEYMGINVKTDEEYIKEMEKFSFINTADILLLNAYANINPKTGREQLKAIINICKKAINDNPKISPSTATKNAKIFEIVQKNIKEKNRISN